MRKRITLLLSALLLFALLPLCAQSASLALSGPATAASGSPVTLTISLVSGGGPAGIQWDMTLPAGAAVASSVTGKTVNCTATRCLLVGPTNATAIPDGPIATVKYTQPSGAASASLVATLAASPAGAPLALAPPASALLVPPQSNCDLNGDGKVDATDIGLAIQQALAAGSSGPSVLDVVRVILAANGAACLR